jgi:hypothetical protein
MFLNKVSRNETSRAFPGFARLVKSENKLKMFWVLFLQGFKLLTKEDVLLSHIGVKQLEFCIVVFVGEGMIEDLVEGGTVKLHANKLTCVMHKVGIRTCQHLLRSKPLRQTG